MLQSVTWRYRSLYFALFYEVYVLSFVYMCRIVYDGLLSEIIL